MKLIITEVQLNVSHSKDFKIPEYHSNWSAVEYISIFILEEDEASPFIFTEVSHHTQENNERFILTCCFLL